MNLTTITNRFLLIIAVTACGLGALLGSYYYYTDRARMYASLETLAHSKIDMLNYTFDSLLRTEQESGIRRIVANAASDRVIDSIAVLDRKLKVIAHSDFSRIGSYAKDDALKKALVHRRQSLSYEVRNGERHLVLIRPLRGGRYHRERRKDIAGLVMLTMRTGPTDALIFNDFVRTAWISAAIIVVALTVTFVTSRSLLILPIRRLAEATRAVAAGDQTAEIPVRTQNELGELTRSFNQMVATLAHRTSELERSNAALDEFAHVASHDLQEPLRSIAGFMQLLNMKYAESLDEKGRHYIARSIAGAERMQTLIQDLLAYSRISSRPMQLEEVDCAAVLRTVRQSLNRAIDESGASIEVGSLPTDLVADRGLLERLFQNLVSNGLKFRKPDEAPVLKISAEFVAAENHWLFVFADNGIGIEEQFAERIFKSFQRLHGPADYPGSGIGLSIARRIVENHRGKIWFESRPGAGTSFKFTISNGMA